MSKDGMHIEDKLANKIDKIPIHTDCPFANVKKDDIHQVVKNIGKGARYYITWFVSVIAAVTLIASLIFGAGTTSAKIFETDNKLKTHMVYADSEFTVIKKDISDIKSAVIEIKVLSQDVKDIKSILMKIVEFSINKDLTKKP